METIKRIIKGGAALLTAIIIANVIVSGYEREVGWIDRENSSTLAIWDPNETFIHGLEGYGIHKVDENGYVNTGKLIDKDYTLAIGASYTQGKEVSDGKRYTDIINKMLVKGNDQDISVYNISQDGYYFPDIIKGFNSVVKEFPNSKTIIIEVGRLTFSAEELEDSLNQRGFDEKELGKNILNNFSTKQKLKLKSKEYFPVIFLIRKQMGIMKNGKHKDKDPEQSSPDAIKAALDKDLALIRSEYNGRLIICYHPFVKIENDGMKIVYNENTPIYEELCEKNNIEFVDISDAFLAAYSEDYSVPYGFWNSTMGEGHFSEDGHRVMAQELYKVLQSQSEEQGDEK